MNTVNLEVLSTERFGNLNFVLAVGDNGRYYAYRETSPYFCLEGENEEEVLKSVAKAVEFYKNI